MILVSSVCVFLVVENVNEIEKKMKKKYLKWTLLQQVKKTQRNAADRPTCISRCSL